MRLPCSVWSIPLLLLVLGFRVTTAQSQIIYDNSSGIGTNVYYSSLEYGDEITLAGTNRIMTEFQFEYFGDFVPSGQETARLHLYKNDGKLISAGAYAPGTVLFDSGNFGLKAGYQTQTFSGLSITLPADLTWTIQFSGFAWANGDEAGLIAEGPPSIGSSYDDFWLKNTTVGWKLYRWVDLTAPDVTDFTRLVAALNSAAPDPVSAYLWARIPTAAQAQIQNAAGDLADRTTTLVGALNAIIEGVSIYDTNRFSGVTLSPDTLQMLARSPAYLDAHALNRMLLHDAYPEAITPKLLADFAARITTIAVNAPTVSISRNSAGVLIEWSGTAVLQFATSSGGPFQDIPAAHNQYQFDTHTAAHQFWRLRN